MLAAVDVSCSLDLVADGPALLGLQVVPVGGVGQLELTQDGQPLAWQEHDSDAGGRTQVVQVAAGEIQIRYTGRVPERPEGTASPSAHERLVALRPSRYCPSDRTLGLAVELLGTVPDDHGERALAVAARVRERTAYVLGSSGGSDDALDTLLSGRGVCRDFAHLVVMLCRSLDVPARMVSVYAPGLSPMDFHAVAEVAVDGCWQLLDATGLAPRPSMARIATGRDAADTAFLTNIGADVVLTGYQVTAVAVGDLPQDRPVALA